MGLGSGIACSIRLNSSLTPEQKALYQDTEVVRRILNESRRIAIVGLSSDNQKASFFVANYLRSWGYEIVPVNPKAKEILGLPCYPTLASVPGKIDLVDIFRPAHECAAIVDEAIAAGARAVWMQLKIINLEAAAAGAGGWAHGGHGPVREDGARALCRRPARGGHEHGDRVRTPGTSPRVRAIIQTAGPSASPIMIPSMRTRTPSCVLFMKMTIPLCRHWSMQRWGKYQ